MKNNAGTEFLATADSRLLSLTLVNFSQWPLTIFVRSELFELFLMGLFK